MLARVFMRLLLVKKLNHIFDAPQLLGHALVLLVALLVSRPLPISQTGEFTALCKNICTLTDFRNTFLYGDTDACYAPFVSLSN